MTAPASNTDKAIISSHVASVWLTLKLQLNGHAFYDNYTSTSSPFHFSPLHLQYFHTSAAGKNGGKSCNEISLKPQVTKDMAAYQTNRQTDRHTDRREESEGWGARAGGEGRSRSSWDNSICGRQSQFKKQISCLLMGECGWVCVRVCVCTSGGCALKPKITAAHTHIDRKRQQQRTTSSSSSTSSSNAFGRQPSRH